MTARVIAFPGKAAVADPAFAAEKAAPVMMPCPLCGVAVGGSEWTCKGCDAKYHIECFWGRMATLEEWTTYIRRVMETEDDFEADVVCAACRQREGRE